MLKKYKPESIFGPVAQISGFTLVAAGFWISTFSFTGIFLLAIGSFVGFSYSRTFVDSNNRRIKRLHLLFGFVPIGKWIEINQAMKIAVRKSNSYWQAFSQSNRSLEIKDSPYSVVLMGNYSQEIMLICKCNSLDSAKKILAELTIILDMNS